MDENVIQIQQSRDMGDDVNVIVPVFKTPERVVIQFDSSSNNNTNRSISPLVIRLAGPVPYASDKTVPYQYNATMIENDQEVPLPVVDSVVNITNTRKVTHSGRVFSSVFPKVFDHIVANITSCNNLSFGDEELPEEGGNHNLALHISMNCKEDALSNVLVDTRLSLNVLHKSTLSRLSNQGTPMRYNSVIVKAFDGSHKTVFGEVDIPVKIGSNDFQITFQVMDIHSDYNCLLGRPLIHEAGSVKSTIHKKFIFVKNGKLVVVDGKNALLVSHLPSFTYVDAEEEVGTLFQTLSVADEMKKTGAPMSSMKDAQEAIQDGSIDK
ncbi:hypothetical protein KIW84_033364 [Lathyrus oleraceus]|uniref:Uncharacterized protein n=1 Tax=Pisum sativum TaxID=3888 RepID=A0A9D4XXE9_PEA|nr:hypothetical protein KIW84_033364 [Pisum sativum]